MTVAVDKLLLFGVLFFLLQCRNVTAVSVAVSRTRSNDHRPDLLLIFFSFISSGRGRGGTTCSTMTTTTTTLFGGGTTRRGRNHRNQNFTRVKNKWKRNSGGLLDYERSIIENDDSISYVLGSDESGRGCIAGPVVAATCCLLTLRDDSQEKPDLEEQLESLLSLNNNESSNGGGEITQKNLIQDSKQLSAQERERIFDIVVQNPDIFAYTVAQRSNTEIDERQNILLTTMGCFQESIAEMACHQLPSGCKYRHVDESSQDKIDDDESHQDKLLVSKAYSIVDGKKTPKLSLIPSLPCRPYVNADAEVFTVALASIIAKVTHDRMAVLWHETYPEYGFLQHKGYATKEHIEAIHKHGPCPLHRMTFKSLKGR
jgi:ribonuclease HII